MGYQRISLVRGGPPCRACPRCESPRARAPHSHGVLRGPMGAASLAVCRLVRCQWYQLGVNRPESAAPTARRARLRDYDCTPNDEHRDMHLYQEHHHGADAAVRAATHLVAAANDRDSAEVIRHGWANQAAPRGYCVRQRSYQSANGPHRETHCEWSASDPVHATIRGTLHVVVTEPARLSACVSPRSTRRWNVCAGSAVAARSGPPAALRGISAVSEGHSHHAGDHSAT